MFCKLSSALFIVTTMTNERIGDAQFYNCSCFMTDNIFLEDYKLHVRFMTEDQFRREYESLLKSLGCVTEQQFEDVLNKISKEVDRRICLAETSLNRAAVIKNTYQPLHPHVYHLQETFLAPEFKHIVKYCQSQNVTLKSLSDLLAKETAPRVYRFPVFNKSFCADLLNELEHFERSAAPKGRPNTMNNYGILLSELGFDEGFVTPLREQYLHPLASVLYPDCGGHCLDSHRAFVVKYDIKEDLDLSYHYDNAEVTLNVSLGRDFTEGNLYFGDMRQVPLNETECSEIKHRAGSQFWWKERALLTDSPDAPLGCLPTSVNSPDIFDWECAFSIFDIRPFFSEVPQPSGLIQVATYWVGKLMCYVNLASVNNS